MIIQWTYGNIAQLPGHFGSGFVQTHSVFIEPSTADTFDDVVYIRRAATDTAYIRRKHDVRVER